MIKHVWSDTFNFDNKVFKELNLNKREFYEIYHESRFTYHAFTVCLRL